MNLKIIVLSLTAGILLVSAYVFSFDYFAAQTEQTEQIFCIQDTKQCPDGSYVGRTGPKCEFANCPTLSFGQSDTSNWKTYRNKKYGFEVRYPQSWRVTRAGITDPEPMPYLLNDIIFDPSNQFREIFIKVYDEKYISMYNFSQDQMVILASGSNLRRINNELFIKKNNFIIQLNIEYEKPNPAFADQILSTFKFVQ